MALHDLTARLWPASDNLRRHGDEVRVIEDLAYVAEPRQKQRLDLFVPRGDGPHPLVVFFHGGFWKTQDRKLARWYTGLYANVGVALARAGIAVAIPSFRQDRYEHTERDAIAAVAWLRAQAMARDLDADRLSLAGHSAGGNLALTLAWDPRRPVGEVCSVVSMCSVHDLPRLLAARPAGLNEADARRYFSDDATMERLSPERHLRSDLTPALVVTSTGDVLALRAEHAAFMEACRRSGTRVEELVVADLGHMGVAMEMGRRRDRVTAALASFVLRSTFEAGFAKEVDARAFLASVLRPKRPRAVAVVTAVSDAKTGAEAWARLASAGLVPASWSEDPRRCFSAYAPCPSCGGSGHGDHGGPCLQCFRARVVLAPPRDAPPSVNAAVAVASLAEETLTALEALAWRSAEALARWGIPSPTRVCWCVAARDRWRRRGHDTVEPSIHASAACRAAGRGENALVRAFERTLTDCPEDSALSDALVDLENSLAWTTAVRAGLRVVAVRGTREGAAPPEGTAFSELADPFEARCAAWETGCAIDRVEPDGTVVIVVPV